MWCRILAISLLHINRFSKLFNRLENDRIINETAYKNFHHTLNTNTLLHYLVRWNWFTVWWKCVHIRFVENFTIIPTVKEIWQSVNTWQSYCQNSTPNSFEAPCIYDKITLTSHISFHSSVLASDSFACCHPTPALLMQTSNLLYLLRITWNISMMSDSRRRSQSTGNTSPDAPDCSTSSRIACRQQSPHTLQ